MSIFQIMLIGMCALAIVMILYMRRQRVLEATASFVWVSVFFGTLLLVLLPSISTQLAMFLGIGRGVDVVIYLALLFFLFTFLLIFLRLKRLQMEITLLVRKISLMETQSRNGAEFSEKQS